MVAAPKLCIKKVMGGGLGGIKRKKKKKQITEKNLGQILGAPNARHLRGSIVLLWGGEKNNSCARGWGEVGFSTAI